MSLTALQSPQDQVQIPLHLPRFHPKGVPKYEQKANLEQMWQH